MDSIGLTSFSQAGPAGPAPAGVNLDLDDADLLSHYQGKLW